MTTRSSLLYNIYKLNNQNKLIIMNYTYFVDITSIFFWVFLIGSTFCVLVNNTLDFLNSNKGNINSKLKDLYKLHPLMKKYFSKSKISKAQEYNREVDKFIEYQDSIKCSFSTLFLLLGLTPFILHSIIRFSPNCNTTIHYILFFVAINTIRLFLDIPVDAYRTFKIETKYGFNKTTKQTFVLDILKNYIVELAFGILGISIFNYVLTKYGPFSASKVCFFVGGLIILGMICEFLYMTVIIRLFNKLKPLKDRNLKRRITRLLESYGYKANKVFVIDASKRSTKANAFIVGFGKCKKIILFDTLLKNYTNDELIAILGHELAHGKLNHLLIGRVISAITTLIITFIVFSFAYNLNLYHTFGFRFVNETNMMEYSLIGFMLASMIVGSIKWILSPLDSYISRKCEYAADRYSVYYTKKKEPMISALIKLTSENCGDVFPNRYYEAYNYSHPSLINRIKAIQNIKLKNKQK